MKFKSPNQRKKVMMILNTDEKYAKYLVPHLEKEHPKTKGKVYYIPKTRSFCRKCKDITLHELHENEHPKNVVCTICGKRHLTAW